MRRSKSNRTPPDAVGEQLTTFKAATASKPRQRDYKPFIPGPNPDLEEFIQQHATPYDPENDDYNIQAFDRDLVVDKAHPPKAIYDMHTYWSKKHWAAIREYIRHYLPEKYYPKGTGLVVDCFSGSGMTGVAAMMEDRPCVLIDASPAAAFISHCYTHPVDPDELRVVYDRMMVRPYSKELQTILKEITGEDIHDLRKELDWLYATKCDRCGGSATTEYVVYSERFQCPKCNEIMALFDCPEVMVPYLVGGKSTQKTELKSRRVCPLCLAKNESEAHRDFVISTRSRKFGSLPVLVSYKCLEGCKPARGQRNHKEQAGTRKRKYFEEHDLGKIQAVEAVHIPHWYPERRMMDTPECQHRWGVKYRAGVASFQTVAELYNRRNLWALAAWLEQSNDQSLVLAVTKACLQCSRMNRNRGSGGGLTSGKYMIPPESRSLNASDRLHSAMKDVIAGMRCLDRLHISGDRAVLISQADACSVKLWKDCSLDYVFTDPPYLNLEVQYGEMNFVWETWLGQDSKWLREEIALNPIRGILWEDAVSRLRTIVCEIFRTLKPGRFASICYHDTSERNWALIQDAILDAGFILENVLLLDPKQKSQDQATKEKVVKSDLVLNCRKPRAGETARNGNGGEFAQISRRVREILIQKLSSTGGLSRDKLWDVVLKRLLNRGQMAEHRFDDLLAEVAFRSESGRWFLKEEFESFSQSDIKNEESAGDALVRFAQLRSIGTPAKAASHIALSLPHLATADTDEKEIETFIKNTISDPEAARKFKLGGRLKGVEFYDCLFFYLTQFLKGRPAGKVPRRNLAEFLEEYLVRFKDSDKWLYRVPDDAEAASLRRARKTGLGRRIRQFVSYLRGEGDFPAERIPDPKTLVAWLKHCAAFGLAEEGVVLFEEGGLRAQLRQLPEDDRYDAGDYYSRCRRRAGRAQATEDEDLEEDEEIDTEATEEDQE